MAKAKTSGTNEPAARKRVGKRWTYVPIDPSEESSQQPIDINAPRQTRGGTAPAPAVPTAPVPTRPLPRKLKQKPVPSADPDDPFIVRRNPISEPDSPQPQNNKATTPLFLESPQPQNDDATGPLFVQNRTQNPSSESHLDPEDNRSPTPPPLPSNQLALSAPRRPIRRIPSVSDEDTRNKENSAQNNEDDDEDKDEHEEDDEDQDEHEADDEDKDKHEEEDEHEEDDDDEHEDEDEDDIEKALELFLPPEPF
ncbi:hypothetical protein H0H92_011624, partial [Tricholoma furcatifolium]